MKDKTSRIALLIDACNSAAAKIGFILNEISTFGETRARVKKMEEGAAERMGRDAA